MKHFKNKITFLLLLITNFCFCQNVNIDSVKVFKNEQIKFNYKSLIIPSILIGYGVWATDNDQLEFVNEEIQGEFVENIDEKISFDDLAQYTPLVATFGLDFVGIKSKNNFKDKLIITTTSTLIMATVVTVLKDVSHIQRPDGSSKNSFPSGHTATAFMNAEILMQEYKNTSIWYGISGYAVATGVGVFRMYNNKHWFSDVITGAGIGILSAKAGYWLYPTVNKFFTKKNKKETNKKTVFIPYFDGKTTGFGLVSTF